MSTARAAKRSGAASLDHVRLGDLCQVIVGLDIGLQEEVETAVVERQAAAVQERLRLAAVAVAPVLGSLLHRDGSTQLRECSIVFLHEMRKREPLQNASCGPNLASEFCN
jgi:hypothetical protein